MQFKDPFQSQILVDHFVQFVHLIDLPFEWKWKLIYRASIDGFGATDFHSKCDGKSPTLIILKAKETGFIFGGYTEATWQGDEIQKSDNNSFIFSLTNKDNNPCKLMTTQSELSIFCSPETGPSFGTGEIHIEHNANIKNEFDSFSDLSEVYIHPQYGYGTNEAKKFLAGSYHFQLSEIEVYHKE